MAVVEAADVVEARTLLSEGKFRIDIVLANVDADNDNPFALTKWIRTEHPGIEVMLAATIEAATRKAGALCEEGKTLQSRPSIIWSYCEQSLAARERGISGAKVVNAAGVRQRKFQQDVLTGCAGASIGSLLIRSYSAITCAPIRRTKAPISTLSSTAIAVVSEP